MIIASHAILTESGFIDGVLEIEDGFFKKIVPRAQYDGSIDLDVKNHKIIPGLFDIHLHGYAQTLELDKKLTATDVEKFLYEMARQGTTACLPCADPSNFSAIAQARYLPKSSRLCGINLEALFACEQYRFFKEEFGEIPELTSELIDEYLKKSEGLLKYIMIAPELPHASEVMRYCQKHDIKVAAGHTLMTAEDFKIFNKEGLVSALTHTSNNMGQMHQRNVGVMGVGMLDPNIYCEIITDFIHVGEEMLKIILKVSGIDKTICVSDSLHLGGLPPGQYPLGSTMMTITDDFKVLDQEGWIQGCYFTLFSNMKKLVDRGLATLEEAVKMSSYNPAVFLGLDDLIGSIKEGKYADFLVLDLDNQLVSTYISGELV